MKLRYPRAATIDKAARHAAMRAGGIGSARTACYRSVRACKRCGCVAPERLAFSDECQECVRLRWSLEGVMR